MAITQNLLQWQARSRPSQSSWEEHRYFASRLIDQICRDQRHPSLRGSRAPQHLQPYKFLKRNAYSRADQKLHFANPLWLSEVVGLWHATIPRRTYFFRKQLRCKRAFREADCWRFLQCCTIGRKDIDELRGKISTSPIVHICPRFCRRLEVRITSMKSWTPPTKVLFSLQKWTWSIVRFEQNPRGSSVPNLPVPKIFRSHPRPSLSWQIRRYQKKSVLPMGRQRCFSKKRKAFSTLWTSSPRDRKELASARQHVPPPTALQPPSTLGVPDLQP